MAQLEDASIWLTQAEADLRAARVEHADVAECHSRYWLQQSYEKAIKAYALIRWKGPANDRQLRTQFLLKHSPLKSVGSGTTPPSKPLHALEREIQTFLQFQWRPAETTTRLVIHTTDDTFWDGPTVGNGIPIVHGYAETVQALQDATVRTYSFADDIGGACNCMDVTPGWSTPYMGMLPIPEATDGGVYPIAQILAGTVSLTDAINTAVEESYCDPYDPQG